MTHVFNVIMIMRQILYLTCISMDIICGLHETIGTFLRFIPTTVCVRVSLLRVPFHRYYPSPIGFNYRIKSLEYMNEIVPVSRQMPAEHAM